MVWKLPPLNALRSFEAAARLSSFTRAADELAVTPGAVSRQIKNIEQFLGLDLFERTAREVTLTASGRQYLDMATGMFSQLHSATEHLRERGRQRPLHIWSSMTFSMRWLVPRLAKYYASNEGMEVFLTTSLKPVDFRSGDIDLAIRYGTGEWEGSISHLLVRTDLLPVCSPQFVAKHKITTLEDLARTTLLHSVIRLDDWRNYLGAAKIDDVDPYRGMRFESSALAYQAAEQGLGVALGQRALVQDDLTSGRLVAPLDFSIPSRGGFYMIYPKDTERWKEIYAFRDWIMSEAETDQK
jgi:LysR family glycine cleavage system transcriptional activator